MALGTKDIVDLQHYPDLVLAEVNYVSLKREEDELLRAQKQASTDSREGRSLRVEWRAIVEELKNHTYTTLGPARHAVAVELFPQIPRDEPIGAEWAGAAAHIVSLEHVGDKREASATRVFRQLELLDRILSEEGVQMFVPEPYHCSPKAEGETLKATMVKAVESGIFFTYSPGRVGSATRVTELPKVDVGTRGISTDIHLGPRAFSVIPHLTSHFHSLGRLTTDYAPPAVDENETSSFKIGEAIFKEYVDGPGSIRTRGLYVAGEVSGITTGLVNDYTEAEKLRMGVDLVSIVDTRSRCCTEVIPGSNISQPSGGQMIEALRTTPQALGRLCRIAGLELTTVRTVVEERQKKQYDEIRQGLHPHHARDLSEELYMASTGGLNKLIGAMRASV